MQLATIAVLAQFGYGYIAGGNPWWPSVEAPPPQYDHAYKGRLVVEELNTVTIHGLCGNTAMACTRGDENGICVIWIDRMYDQTVRDSLIKHETAHCNGWRHPNS